MKGHRVKTFISLLVSIALLFWVFHDVSFEEIWAEIRSAHPGLLLLSSLMVATTLHLRAIRWITLLPPALANTSFHSRLSAVSIGFMANNLLPARLGEFVRAYCLSRAEPIKMSAALASIVVERILDGLVLALFLCLALLAPAFPVSQGEEGSLVLNAAAVGSGVFVFGFVALWTMVRFPDRALALFKLTFGRVLPDKFARSGAAILLSFIAGLASIRNLGRLVRALMWTVVLWVWNALSFLVAFLAFSITEPGVVGAVFLQSVVAFAVSVPSSPGSFGPFEAASRLGLGIYDVDLAQTVGFATGYHLATFIPMTLMGLWYLRRLGVTWSELRHSEDMADDSEHAVSVADETGDAEKS